MNAGNPPQPELDPMDVAACAYLIWEKEGKPHGRDKEHWLEAETLLHAMREAEAKAARESTKTASPTRTPAPAASKRKVMRAARQDRQDVTGS